MRIIFKKIEIHNFMSFSDEVFDFDINHGMNLVTGKNFDIPNSKNGAGKSSVFLALLWGLYGQFPNKIKSEHISNRNINDKEVRVIVFLNIDDIEYKVISGLNKRSAGYFNLYKIENNLEIEITKSSILETREFFEKEIIHCDISLFLRTILLTSEQNYNFFCLKKQDKKEFIEKLFDIGIFGEMYSNIHKDLLQIDKQILAKQNQIIILNQNKEEYQKRLKDFDDKNIIQKNEIEKQIDIIKIQIQQYKSKVVKKNTDLISKYEDIKKKLSETKDKLQSSILDKKVQIAKDNSEIQLIINDISLKKNALSKHSELLNKLCKNCQNIFLSYHNLTSYQSDINKAQNTLQNKNLAIEIKKNKYKELSNKLLELEKKLNISIQKINELNLEYDKVVLTQNKNEKTLDMLIYNLKQLQDKKNPYFELLNNVNLQLIEEQKQLKKLEDENKYLKIAEQIVSQDSLKKFIIKDLISIINNKIKSYLVKMGSKYTCIFDENLDYEFMTESGPCELYNFSCGEKKRIEIATCLSFRDFISQRSNISSNILILDEYIDSGIDTLAVESILSILKEFTLNQKQNIFIISHRAEINNDLFDRIIELQKEKGISHIKYFN